MVSRLQQTLSRLGQGLCTGTLKRVRPDTFSGGRPVKTFDPKCEVEFFTVPEKTDEEAVKGEVGGQILINRHFYFKGSDFNIPNFSLLTFEDVEYEVRGPESRKHGDFTYVFGRNITRNDA